MTDCEAAMLLPEQITKPWAGNDLGLGIGESIEFGDHVEFSYNDGRDGSDEEFPIMSKFISTSEWLSIQVHPNDEQARKLEGLNRGKFEAWYIMKTPPAGGKIICGPIVARDEYTCRTVRPGDVVFIEPGTIHAIGPDILLWEIQQNCNITYRINDWGRDRELHIEKANLVMTDKVAEITRPTFGTIIDNEHFKVTLLELDGPVPMECDGRPMILTNLDHCTKWLHWSSEDHNESITMSKPSTIYLEKNFKGILDGSGTYCITTW